jgi:MerR family transcriptional regulator, mercuric resistance operon regulatory protein
MSVEDHLRIGEVAARARANVQTLRYYERIGLLPEPRRLSSGYRAYPPKAVHTVRFVKRAQALGFTLTEIRGLLRLTGSDDGCAETRELANRRIARLDAEIAGLQAMRDELWRLATGCEMPHPGPRCPITDAIKNAAG